MGSNWVKRLWCCLGEISKIPIMTFSLQFNLMGNCTGRKIIKFQGKFGLKKCPANGKCSSWGCFLLGFVSASIFHALSPPDEMHFTAWHWLNDGWCQSWSLWILVATTQWLILCFSLGSALFEVLPCWRLGFFWTCPSDHGLHLGD